MCIRPKPKINTNICFCTSFWPIFKIHVLTCSQFFLFSWIRAYPSSSTNLNLLYLEMLWAKFCEFILVVLEKEVKRLKCFTDGRTDRKMDRKWLSKIVLFFQLRWAKNKGVRIYSFISSLHFYIVIVIDKNNQCQKFKNSKTTSKPTYNLSTFTLICWI